MAPNLQHAISENLHNQVIQRQEDSHLYTSLSPWHFPNHNPTSASSPPSAMLQRPAPFVQRQLPSFHHAAPNEYVNIPPFQTVYNPPSYYREGWSDTLGDEGFASRSQAHYDEGETAVTVPPHNPTTRSYTSDREQPPQFLRYPDAYQVSAPHAEFQPTAMEYVAHPPPDLQTFQADQQRSAPVTQLLNYPLVPTTTTAPAIHGQHPPLMVAHAPMGWPNQNSDIGHEAVQGQQASTMHSDLVVSGPNESPWSNVRVGIGVSMDAGYERMPLGDSGWGMLPAPSEGSYSHHGPPLPLPSPHDRPRRLSTKHKPPATKVASSYIPRQQKVKVSRRKGPLDVQNRKKASNMRKHKVCIRCKMYKAGCDEGHPCQRCLKSFENARSFLEPCFRDHIQDTSRVRSCNGRCNQVEADFLKYVWQEGDGIFSMEIIWCLPGTSDPIPMKEPLRIRCREFFLPEADSNSIKFEWVNTDGQLINIKQPPYAIFDTAALQADVDAYFCSNLHSMEQWIFQRICRDELALLTYREAWRLRDNGLLGNNILDLTLRLQCLSIMSQGYGTVCSSNIPGISEIDFKALGHSEYEAYDRDSRHRPLPAAINHQMDVAFVKILRRLEKECHKVLTQRVFKPKIKPWYELFLTFFVLYWNLEYIHQGADKYIRSKSGTSTQIHVSSVVKQQIKKWDDTFDIILRYWRTLLRTFVPFKVARENPEDLRTKGHLPDIESFNYMMQVVAIFDRQGVDRHAPPLTGTSSSQFSRNSKWITALFKEGGA